MFNFKWRLAILIAIALVFLIATTRVVESAPATPDADAKVHALEKEEVTKSGENGGGEVDESGEDTPVDAKQYDGDDHSTYLSIYSAPYYRSLIRRIRGYMVSATEHI